MLDIEQALEKTVADAAGEIAGDLVDAFKKEKAALDTLRREIEKAIGQLKAAGKKETLVFFIDELDRCRPTFAMEMLERIKHLFDVSNIVFVLSIDKSQLEASTAAVYGERINAPEYLRRFIDLEFGVPVVHTKQFTKALFTRFDLDGVFAQRTGERTRQDKEAFIDAFSELADLFDLSLRARERCMTCMAVVMDQTPSNHYLDPILVAFLIVLRTKRPSLFHDLCKGSASAADAMEFLATLRGGRRFVADQSGVIIETYLLAGDPDTERKQAIYQELQKKANDTSGASDAHVRARDLLEARKYFPGGMRGRFELGFVAKKIDLAAAVRE